MKVAIVTGGAKGIGKSISEELLDSGYSVLINYFTSKNSANELVRKYENAYDYFADVSNANQVKSMIQYVYDKFGKIDLLVNNSGIDLNKLLQDTTEDEFEKILKVNLFSAFYTSKYVVPIMVKQKFGQIINISSIWGEIGASCETAYSISKAGLDGLTKSLAKELAPSNVRVNSIAPGFIDTDMNNSLNAEEKNKVIEYIPLGKIGLPIDIAKAVLFLEEAKYITGQVMDVNGGWRI